MNLPPPVEELFADWALIKSTLQKLAICTRVGKPQSFAPGNTSFGKSAKPKIEFANHHMPARITLRNIVSANLGQTVETGLRTMQIGFGHRAIERMQRRGRDLVERIIQARDSLPGRIGKSLCPAVLPGNSRFHVIARQLIAGGRSSKPLHPFTNLIPVPGRAILLLEQNDCSIDSDTCVEPSAVEAHQGKQGMHRGNIFANRVRGQHSCEAQSFVAKVATNGCITMSNVTPLAEQEINNGKNRVEPGMKLVGGGSIEFDVERPQSITRALDSLLHINFGRQQSASNFRRAETAKHPKRKRDARFNRHRLVTANEKQAKRFIANLICKVRFVQRQMRFDVFSQPRQHPREYLLATQRINRQVAGSPIEPPARIFRHTAPRPNLQSLQKRSLNDIFNEFQPAHAQRTRQHGAKPAELVTKKVFNQRPRLAHA